MDRQGCLKRGYTTPLVADMHFAPKVPPCELGAALPGPVVVAAPLLSESAPEAWRTGLGEPGVQVALMVADCFDKIRINPGNFADGRCCNHPPSPSLALLSHRTRPLPPRTPDWFRFNGDTWTMSRKTFKEINYDNPADYQARIRPARYPRHGGFRGRCSSPAAHTACGVLWGGLRVVFTGDARDASLRDGRQKKRWRDEGGESTQAGAAGGNRRSWTTSRRRSRRSSSSASRHAAFTPTRKRAPCLACRLVSDSLCRRSWSGGQYRSRRRRRSRGWAVSRQGCRGLACSCCCAFTSVEDAGRDAHPVPTNQPRACAARLPLARARGEAALRGDGGGSASVEGHVSKGETRDGGGVRGRGSWGARCASGPTTGRSRRGRSPTTATRRRAWSSPPSSSPAYAGPHHAPRAPQAAMASAGKGWAVSSLAGVRGRGRRAE